VTGPTIRPEPAGARPAVFLDRDGTIIEDAGYLRDPRDVRLLPGSAQAIRCLNVAGVPAIVVSNQSGIARGLLTQEQYRLTEERLDELLSQQGSRLAGHYFCPHLPEVDGPCECRKPGTLLYRQAAQRFGIALDRSWWVGDRVRDVLPAEAFGGRGVLVLTGAKEALTQEADAQRFKQVPDLLTAVKLIVEQLPH
jgi:D-glycero-D-manno-heptose 1,7-bisphosphate phosphatase